MNQNKKITRVKDNDRVITLFRKWRETQRKEYLEQIQDIVNDRKEDLVLLMQDPRMRVVFAPGASEPRFEKF